MAPRTLVILPLILTMLSCTSASAPTPSTKLDPHLQVTALPAAEFLHVNSIALSPPQFERSVRAVVDREKELGALLQDIATSSGELELLDPRKMAPFLPEKNAGTSLAALLNAAKKAGADALLESTILEYQEREGSAIGTSTPARVNFSMSLYRVSDGARLWQGNYLYYDQSVTENLLALGDSAPSGHGWRSARDLLRMGVSAALHDLAERRRQAFMSGK